MVIEYGRKLAKKGAGPATLGLRLGVIKMIITHAAAVHGLEIPSEPVDLARIALKRLGLIGKGAERDRRPARDELNRLFRCFDDNERLTLPMTRIMKFPVATAIFTASHKSTVFSIEAMAIFGPASGRVFRGQVNGTGRPS